MEKTKKRPLRFRKYGRTYQLRLEDPADLDNVLALGESLWMATSAPVDAFACDRVFLDFVDYDHNGRIRCDELRAAVTWTTKLLADRSAMGMANDTLKLAAVNCNDDEGERLHRAAKLILANLGKSGAEEISLADVRSTQKILAAADANGDGIIPPAVADDPEIQQFIKDVIAVAGGETDAGGKAGITVASLEQFLAEAGAYVAWSERGNPNDAELMPFGADTTAAYGAFAAIRAKLDEFFLLSATIAYDANAAATLGLRLEKSANPADELDARLRAAPIAPLNADATLDLAGQLNPVYKQAVQALREKVLSLTLGRDPAMLTADDWQTVCAQFAAHAKWQAEQPETKAASLGLEKLKTYLEPRFREALETLIAADKAVVQEIQAISQVEKLILYQQWLLEFANNVVSFSRLYNPEVRALFEAGTLVMDGRHFALCVKVNNRAEHAPVAVNSQLFIMYVELTHGPIKETHEVAAAVTSGGMGNLYVGKHGIFLDRDNRLWDARVVQIIENPISFSEALTMPFRRIGQLIRGQVERFAGSSQNMLEQKVTQQAAAISTTVQTAAQPPQPAAQQPASASSNARDLLMGGGVAIAALGSSFAYVTKSLKDVNGMIIFQVFSVVVLLILVPTIINAWIKLRRRDIGTLLEASGWAVNARMRLTRIMRGVFTRRPGIPKGSEKERLDQLLKYAGIAKRPTILLKGVAEVGRNVYESL